MNEPQNEQQQEYNKDDPFLLLAFAVGAFVLGIILPGPWTIVLWVWAGAIIFKFLNDRVTPDNPQQEGGSAGS